MGSLFARLFGSSYYLHTVQRDTAVLHYRRNPTWRSLILFIGNYSTIALLNYMAERTLYIMNITIHACMYIIPYSALFPDTLHINSSR